MDDSALRRDTLSFGPFRLDPARRVLSHVDATVTLRPKTLEVLLYLLHHVGAVVPKHELLAAVWKGSAVSEYVLTTCISELRTALGDDIKQPRFLKTVHRSGYQFLAEVHELRGPSAAFDAAPAAAIVGRELELAQLQAALRRAVAGQRQVVFITGEMGIGKTTLADEFLRRTQGAPQPAHDLHLVARGQCIEQFGAGEPYMPVFEAIGRLGRTCDTSLVVDVLRRHAPIWLMQIPGLLPPEQRLELRRELPAGTQEHMLRTIADGIEALCQRRVLVLLLEDLHLSDHATLELVTALALRRGLAHLLVVGTFRSAETHGASAPFQSLKQQLQLHQQCEEIVLAPLGREAVATYLSERFAGLDLPPGLAATIHDRTDGNPLFVGRLVDQLLDEGVLHVDPAKNVLRQGASDIARHVPRSLRALIEQRTEGLAPAEREVLETASVVGVQFWSSSVATTLALDREEVESVCAQLSRRHGLLTLGEPADVSLPDLGARFGFSHSLYQQVLYERIDVSRRQRLHRAIGDALCRSWATRAAEVAAELASHFERGGNLTRAIEFYDKAAVGAAAQGANREAVDYLDRALALFERSADDTPHRERQLDLLMSRGPSVLAGSGYGSLAVRDNYQRALDLARQLDNPMRQMACLLALSIYQLTRANLVEGEQLAVELVRVAERVNLPQPLIAQLHNPLSQARLHQGAVEESLALSDAAVAAMEILPMPQAPPDSRPALWAEPRVMLHCQRAAASFALGRLAQAGAAIEQALSIAHELRHPFNLAYATCYAALYEDTMGRSATAIRLARQAIEISHTYEFTFWEGIAEIFCGHALACSGDAIGGTQLLRQGMQRWLGTGAMLATTMHFNMLAEACMANEDLPAASAALSHAQEHAERTGEKVFLAETLRLQAECQRRSGAAVAQVRLTLELALSLSRKQGTRLWQLRSTLALYRLRPTKQARAALAEVCHAFDQEPASLDVTQARAALSLG